MFTVITAMAELERSVIRNGAGRVYNTPVAGEPDPADLSGDPKPSFSRLTGGIVGSDVIIIKLRRL